MQKYWQLPGDGHGAWWPPALPQLNGDDIDATAQVGASFSLVRLAVNAASIITARKAAWPERWPPRREHHP